MKQPTYLPKVERPRNFRDEYCETRDDRRVYLCPHIETEFCPGICDYAVREERNKDE